LVSAVKKRADGNKMEAHRETNSRACTNTIDVDINLEPGVGGADKNVESQNQADGATEIPKTNSESMKVVQDKYENTSAGLDIGFLAAEFPSHSDIENYVTRGHVDFPLTFPKDGINQTFPIGIPKFSNISPEQHTRDWLSWSQLSFSKVSLLLTAKSTTICIFAADCSVHESGLLVYIVCAKIGHTIIQKIARETIAHKHSFNRLGIFVHDSVRACMGSFQKLIHNVFLQYHGKVTGPVAILYRPVCIGLRYVRITNTNTRCAKFNKLQGRACSH